MKSKTKALKKGNYIPGSATPAPAKKAENVAKTTSTNHIAREMRKIAEARSRARRYRSIMKLGLSEEEVKKLFAEENNRMVLVLLHGNYTIEDGTKKKKVRKRDEHHKLISIEEVDVPNVLHGYAAAKKYVDNEGIVFISGDKKNAIWVRATKDDVDSVVEKLSILGRVSVTKPEPVNKENIEKKIEAKRKADNKAKRKPTNNTTEVKAAAKAKRKAGNIEKANMRPYYAALRKGGVSARIKKYNKTLAKKIEKWIEEKKAAEASRVKGSKEERAKHRQLTSLEMKANKRARKARKFLAAQERRKEREKLNAERNAKMREKRAQKPQKHVQTELKMAA